MFNLPIRGVPPKKSEEPQNLFGTSFATMRKFINDLEAIKKNLAFTSDQKIKEIDKKIKEVDDKLGKVIHLNSEYRNAIEKVKQEAISYVQSIKQGPAGKDADHEKIVRDVLAQIPAPQVIDEGDLVQRVAALIPVPEPVAQVETDPMGVINKILELADKGNFKLKSEHISGLDQTINAFWNQVGRRGYLHGGGDTVVAGTNVTITTNKNGQKVISASGGASGVTTLNGLSGAVILVAGSNITLTPSGNSITIASSGGGGSGTVTSVASADGNATIANPTTTPVITIVSAPKLQTARTINGTSFDGTGNIVVTAAAGTLTGTTLNATVVTSSLTTVGTIGTGVWQGTKITPSFMTTMTATVGGTVPTPPNNTTTFLRGDGTFATPSGGGTPGGSDTQVQFNDSGAFGGDANFEWDKNATNLYLSGRVGILPHDNISGSGDDLFIESGSSTGGGGDGGILSLTTGSPNGNGNGGQLALSTNAGIGSGAGGDIDITTGSGGATSGTGGNVNMVAGNAQGGNSNGGFVGIFAGNGFGSGDGGSADFDAGNAGSTGNGGDVFIDGGAGGATSGVGGNINIIAGAAQGGNSNGGNVNINSGNHTGSGVDGYIDIYSQSAGIGISDSTSPTKIILSTDSNTKSVILDASLIATSNKTFTFPNQTGTFVVDVASVDLATQAAAITATTLFTPVITGFYRISVYLQITRAASTSSVLGGAGGVVLTYNDGDGNVAQTDTVSLMNAAGAIAISSATNTTATNLNGTVVIYAKAGVAIQYAIGYTSVGVTSMQYSAHLRVEAI